MSILARVVEEKVPSWTCPDCGTVYFTGGNGVMRFCPACRVAKNKLEQEYWDRKHDGMRSVANDIVAKTLAQIGRKGE